MGRGERKEACMKRKKFRRHFEKKTVATSVLCQPQRFLCGDSEIYTNAHPDRAKREALSCLQDSGLSLTWKRATGAVSLLGIQRMSAR